MPRKSIAAFVVAAICFFVGGARATLSTDKDPIALYGDELVFDVFRDDTRVGSHVVRFNRTEQELIVHSRFELSIEVLFFTVYRFLYESEAAWRSGEIDRIEVDVDDNGDPFRFEAMRKDGITEILSENGRSEFQGALFPTNHWNSNVLSASQVLNTLTGEVNTVRIEPSGREIVPTERGDTVATKYAYSGEFETEVWYDEQGRWVKMRFAGKDGVPIEYICRRCQGSQPESASK